MEQKEPLLELTYEMRQDDFVVYSRAVGNRMVKKRRRNTKLLGGAELLFGLLFLIILLVQGNRAFAPYVLGVLLSGMGLYSLLYFDFLFPKQLDKSSRQLFARDPKLKKVISLTFFADRLVQKADKTGEIPYGQLEGVQRAGEYDLLTDKQGRIVLLPRRILGEKEQTVWESLLEKLYGEYGVKPNG